ncbi:esterase-like activity of phytase family protein [Bernardetia sp. OM2101]|uniref:esterase-like activity of phytase family protein n=1 Tax=Bernardetia sp. OM2101 TaxID=3344876 RepID=UPI0035D0985C
MRKIYNQKITYLSLYSLVFFVILLLTNCQTQKNNSTQTQNQKESKPPFKFRFIGEKIIPFEETFGEDNEKMTVGGISGIDYNKSTDSYYLLSDDLFDENGRLRFYTAKLNYTKDSFTTLQINSVSFLKQENTQLYPTKSEGMKTADPESIIFSSQSNTLFWSSEGDRERNILPFIAEMDTNGNQIRKLNLPQHFIDTTQNKGWYHNAAIESLTFSTQKEEKIWLLSETSLQQDGEMTKKTEGIFPIRLMCLDRNTSEFEQEFVYLAEPVAKEPIPKTAYGLNGVVEILEWKTDKNTNSKNTQFLVLERSYSQGYPKDEGTVVKLFLVDTENATDSKNIESLKNLVPNKDYVPLKKTLVADLSKMNLNHVDNIEGMSFGKNLENGNKTIIFVSDNNFQAIQKTQFLIFEIIE